MNSIVLIYVSSGIGPTLSYIDEEDIASKKVRVRSPEERAADSPNNIEPDADDLMVLKDTGFGDTGRVPYSANNVIDKDTPDSALNANRRLVSTVPCFFSCLMQMFGCDMRALNFPVCMCTGDGRPEQKRSHFRTPAGAPQRISESQGGLYRQQFRLPWCTYLTACICGGQQERAEALDAQRCSRRIAAGHATQLAKQGDSCHGG